MNKTGGVPAIFFWLILGFFIGIFLTKTMFCG